MLRAVLFDIGGTLLSEDSYDLPAAVRAALSIPAVDRNALRKEAWTKELSEWVAGVLERGHTDESLTTWIRQRVPAGDQTVVLSEVEDRMWAAGVRMSAIPGAQEALQAVLDAGFRCAAISNTIFSARRMSAALTEAGIEAPLEFLLSSADLGRAKPEPRIFELALDRLGVPAEETVYVGDSWKNDVRGALEAGLRAIWISSDRAPEDLPHARIPSIAELPALLENP